MDPEDGCLTAYDVDDDGTTAFTSFGLTRPILTSSPDTESSIAGAALAVTLRCSPDGHGSSPWGTEPTRRSAYGRASPSFQPTSASLILIDAAIGRTECQDAHPHTFQRQCR